MSDLLKRKPKRIERSQTVVPKTTFSLKDLPEQNEEEVVEKSA